MKFVSHGASREVTGSCHELQIGDKRILLDCGLFQGSRKKSVEKNAAFAFDPAKDIDAVILSHAHMDHAGRIPLLYKRGYRGKVFCTHATKDLAAVMLLDSAYIQEKDEEFFCKHLPHSMMPCIGPLYTQEDARACMNIFVGQNYGEWFEVVDGVQAKFLDAGHVLGAAMIILEIGVGIDSIDKNVQCPMSNVQTMTNAQFPNPGIRIGFTGDLGRDTLPIIRDPEEMPSVDVLLCESTYGNRAHGTIETAKHELRDAVIRTAKRGGKILIPAFSLERTQEILYDLHLLWDAKEIPAIPIVIDSPLASRVTQVFMKHPECYDSAMYEKFLAKQHNPFQFSLVRYTESVEESKELNAVSGPMIIMAGSGMCEGGRIRHHLKEHIEDPRSTVIAVGYMAENTLGRRLVEKHVASVKIFDEVYQKKAEVVSINAYSGHADMNDLDAFLASVIARDDAHSLRRIFFVHGEEEQMAALAKRTARHTKAEICMPERGVAYQI